MINSDFSTWMFMYVIWYNKLKRKKKKNRKLLLSFQRAKRWEWVGGKGRRHGLLIRWFERPNASVEVDLPTTTSRTGNQWEQTAHYQPKPNWPSEACGVATMDGLPLMDEAILFTSDREENQKKTCSSPHAKEAVGRAVMWRQRGGLIAFDRRGRRRAISLSYSTPSGIVNGWLWERICAVRGNDQPPNASRDQMDAWQRTSIGFRFHVLDHILNAFFKGWFHVLDYTLYLFCYYCT